MERHIEYRLLADLRPDERNPKSHDLALLGRSMARFGYIEPVVIDERTDLLVSGHGRVEAALRAVSDGLPPPEGVSVGDDGAWRLPVVRGWASENDDEAAAALVALNRTTQVGGWDDQRLYDILDGLADIGDLDAIGFTEDDLEVLARFVNAVDYEEGSETDPYAEWEGMPAFDGEATAKPFRTILVHFQDEAAAIDFNERLDGALPVSDRSMWYPPRQRRKVTGLHYVEAET